MHQEVTELSSDKEDAEEEKEMKEKDVGNMEYRDKHDSLGIDINAIPEKEVEAQDVAAEEMRAPIDNLIIAADLIDNGFSQVLRKICLMD